MQANDNPLSRHTALTLVIIAVVQSALLLILHKALIHNFWPATDPRWLYAAYTVFVGVPIFLYLGLKEWRERANPIAAAVLGIVLFWLGWHAGWVAIPYATGNGEQARMIGQLVVTGLLLVFMAGFLFRGWRETGDWRKAPAAFLSASWDNALTLGFLHLFLLVFWLLLFLWAALFDIIGIEFFGELFTEEEFIYPVTGLVGGLGLVIIRQRVKLVSSVRYMCEALIRALLPLTAFILLAFLAALPFTGLEPLWETGFGTLLLILISLIILFAFNADFGGGRSLGYPAFLDWLVRAGVAATPVSLALAGWGLGLRVDQYGWTLSRYWALFIILTLAAFAVAYGVNMAVAAIKKRRLDYGDIERTNTALALALMLTLVLVNTGFLDFRKLAAADQIERLHAGEVEEKHFDADYLRFVLGHYGERALIQLKNDVEADNPDFAQRIQHALDRENRWSSPEPQHVPEDDTALRAQFNIPEDDDVPTGLLRALLEDDTTRRNCLHQTESCRVIELEIHGEPGWALFTLPRRQWIAHSRLALPTAEDNAWLDVGVLARGQCPDSWQDSENEGQDNTRIELITRLAPFLRIGSCAFGLQLHIEPKPIPERPSDE